MVGTLSNRNNTNSSPMKSRVSTNSHETTPATKAFKVESIASITSTSPHDENRTHSRSSSRSGSPSSSRAPSPSPPLANGEFNWTEEAMAELIHLRYDTYAMHMRIGGMAKIATEMSKRFKFVITPIMCKAKLKYLRNKWFLYVSKFKSLPPGATSEQMGIPEPPCLEQMKLYWSDELNHGSEYRDRDVSQRMAARRRTSSQALKSEAMDSSAYDAALAALHADEHRSKRSKFSDDRRYASENQSPHQSPMQSPASSVSGGVPAGHPLKVQPKFYVFHDEYDVILLKAVMKVKPYAAAFGKITRLWDLVGDEVSNKIGVHFKGRRCRDRYDLLVQWYARTSAMSPSQQQALKPIEQKKLGMLGTVLRMIEEHRRDSVSRRDIPPTSSHKHLLNNPYNQYNTSPSQHLYTNGYSNNNRIPTYYRNDRYHESGGEMNVESIEDIARRESEKGEEDVVLLHEICMIEPYAAMNIDDENRRWEAVAEALREATRQTRSPRWCRERYQVLLVWYDKYSAKVDGNDDGDNQDDDRSLLGEQSELIEIMEEITARVEEHRLRQEVTDKKKQEQLTVGMGNRPGGNIGPAGGNMEDEHLHSIRSIPNRRHGDLRLLLSDSGPQDDSDRTNDVHINDTTLRPFNVERAPESTSSTLRRQRLRLEKQEFLRELDLKQAELDLRKDELKIRQRELDIRELELKLNREQLEFKKQKIDKNKSDSDNEKETPDTESMDKTSGKENQDDQKAVE